MKRIVCIAFVSLALMSATTQDHTVMTQEKGVYVVNTTTLAADVEGYVGATPLKIYIKKNKVLRIEALKNEETPKYFLKVKKHLLPKWDGMTVKKALKADVDGVTGATYSSDAVKENVKRGIEYYQKNK
jgi:electron transport complex protein RnfG